MDHSQVVCSAYASNSRAADDYILLLHIRLISQADIYALIDFPLAFIVGYLDLTHL